MRRLGPPELELLLDQARSTAPTYPEIGKSRNDQLPSGYHHVRVRERVGEDSSFERAALGLRTWVAHVGAGLRVYPLETLEPNATVIVMTSFGPLQMVAPCRIVSVFKEPDVFGFSYGTLPGHPEVGEECFVLERIDGGTFFTVSAFSRPTDLVARLSGPVGRRVQREVTQGYVDALRDFVRSESSTGEIRPN
jgi:uncharacterized protein (UPF0548 family)